MTEVTTASHSNRQWYTNVRQCVHWIMCWWMNIVIVKSMRMLCFVCVHICNWWVACWLLVWFLFFFTFNRFLSSGAGGSFSSLSSLVCVQQCFFSDNQSLVEMDQSYVILVELQYQYIQCTISIHAAISHTAYSQGCLLVLQNKRWAACHVSD